MINIKNYFNAEMEKLRRSVGARPSLMIIDATDGDSANQIYIKKKVEDFNSLGWPVQVAKAENNIDLLHLLERVRKDNSITSAIVQLPMAKRFSADIKHLIPAGKDCDGITIDPLVMPATVRGIIDYLDANKFGYNGKNAIVIGRSDIVGKPMAKALTDRDMTVTLCHSKTDPEYIERLTHYADLIVVATGHPGTLHRTFDNQAFVVDVGINRVDGKLVGDFVEDPTFNYSTPVPGGVGLLTRLGLMKNCADLTQTGLYLDPTNYDQITFDDLMNTHYI